MDRDARDTFELLDEIENVLGIRTCPMNWPIGSGKEFKGVYDRAKREVELFSDTKKDRACAPSFSRIRVTQPCTTSMTTVTLRSYSALSCLS